jgi:hypothetical protein
MRTAIYGLREASEVRAGKTSGELSVLLRKSNPACLFIGWDAGYAISLLSVSFCMQQWC